MDLAGRSNLSHSLAAALVPVCAVAGIPFASAVAPLSGALLLNRRFYVFLAVHGGWRLAAAGAALHMLYYLYSAGAFAAGTVLHSLAGIRSDAHAGGGPDLEPGRQRARAEAASNASRRA